MISQFSHIAGCSAEQPLQILQSARWNYEAITIIIDIATQGKLMCQNCTIVCAIWLIGVLFSQLLIHMIFISMT